MLKLYRGLKKKKKDKKNKHKEEELFNEQELERYRREDKAGTAVEAEQEGQEEWQKFNEITVGTDNVIKKTQKDLDRIKKNSFFLRKPKQTVLKAAEEKLVSKKQAKIEEGPRLKPRAKNPAAEKNKQEAGAGALFNEQSSEDEDENGDDIYANVIPKIEVKLAYTPESPIYENIKFDPFNTSIVDRVIQPNPSKKNKRCINLKCAVEVLSGKEVNNIPDICESTAVRKRPKPVNLLFESFDENTQNVKLEDDKPIKTMLDDDPDLHADILPLNLVTTPVEIKPHSVEEEGIKTPQQDISQIINGFDTSFISFDTINSKSQLEYDIDDEFTALAFESFSKSPRPKVVDSFDTFFAAAEKNKQGAGAGALFNEQSSEDEDENGDDIYANVIPKIEVKLAYNPESPIYENIKFDPFNTPIEDNVIQPKPSKTNKGYINHGCAVEVLSGKKVENISDVCGSTAVRKRPKPENVLFKSFDENTQNVKHVDDKPIKTLLDDDPDLHADVLPLTLVTTPVEIKPHSVEEEDIKTPQQDNSQMINGFDTSLIFFDTINSKSQLEYDTDDEFTALAFESLSKSPWPDDIDPCDTSFADHQSAYTPESPTNENIKFDPFNTPIVDKVIQPEPSKKNKRYINHGCAVNVLSKKKVDIRPDVCRSTAVRKRPKPVNLLFKSFNGNTQNVNLVGDKPMKTLFDDNPDLQADALPFTLVTTPVEIKPHTIEEEGKKTPQQDISQIINEFDTKLILSDTINIKSQLENDIEAEFAALAVGSLSKSAWPEDIDPFDTSFADHLVPAVSDLSIQRDQTNQLIDKKTAEKEFFESVRLSSPEHRDFLGASTTDLSIIGHRPIEPQSPVTEATQIDPFDTSFVDNLLPGKEELKLLEKELLEDSKSPCKQIVTEKDDEFDPRAEETAPPNELNFKEKGVNTSKATFSFEEYFFFEDPHGGLDEAKSLDPYYPTDLTNEENFEIDPFDPSFDNIRFKKCG